MWPSCTVLSSPASRIRGVSSNGAENWEKAFSVLDSLGAHVYFGVYGTP